MAKFERANFDYFGGYLHYTFNGERKFVARFKYNKRDKPGFVSFLMKNFTVEEYFAYYDAGNAPLPILQSRGYVSKTVQMAIDAGANYSFEKRPLTEPA